ncbi:hypothetical protein SAMN05444000_1044 [Shimia gijangensis]|uniref:Uncharacterized protein n=1 Tax=Shimia gijangensis TaxID=1470563 RepID=A0A1M6F8T6_9RHOB|nr:hypothetical protein SAMN05444000_1044 [Shimia gijangensis]
MRTCDCRGIAVLDSELWKALARAITLALRVPGTKKLMSS